MIRLSSLGDVVLTTPVYRNLKSAWPDCRITVLVKPAFAPVLEGHPCIDEIIPYQGFFSTLRAIRKGGFSHLLDLHGKAKSILLAALSGVPERLRYRKAVLARRFFVLWRRPSAELSKDTIDRYLEPLAAWGVAAPDRTLTLEAGSAASVVGERLRGQSLASSRWVALHPGASWATKRWPAERYAALARRLSESQGVRVLLVGGRKEVPRCEEIRRLAAPAAVENWAGRTTLAELKGLMPHLSLFVTNCTGPMHIAAALGVPTVAVYGPTTRELGFFPVGEHVRVIETGLACRPCSLHGDPSCPEGHFLCMRLLTTDRVFAACQELLNVREDVKA